MTLSGKFREIFPKESNGICGIFNRVGKEFVLSLLTGQKQHDGSRIENVDLRIILDASKE